jgi:hypothetical protein
VGQSRIHIVPEVFARTITTSWGIAAGGARHRSAVVDVSAVAEGHHDDEKYIVANDVDNAIVANPHPEPVSAL